MVRRLGIALAALLAVAGSCLAQNADPALEAHLRTRLACLASPDPTAILLHLSQEKRIHAASGRQLGGATCWTITPALLIRGQPFTHICAVVDDPLLLQLFPQFFPPSRAAAGGASLSLETDTAPETLRDWARRFLGRAEAPLHYQVGQSFLMEGKTSLECSSRNMAAAAQPAQSR